jgi:hypothetical protein
MLIWAERIMRKEMMKTMDQGRAFAVYALISSYYTILERGNVGN